MLAFHGFRRTYCDGLSRRSFLTLGGLAMGGLGLPELLEAEAQATAASTAQPSRAAHKSVIMIFLSGGLAHQDTFDLKPDAPEGIRGEFKPIASRVPGVQVSELLPQIAGVLDKVAVLRNRSAWSEALAEARHAEELLDQGEADPALRERVRAIRDDLVAQVRQPQEEASPPAVYLESAAPGDLDSLTLRPEERRPPGPGEVTTEQGIHLHLATADWSLVRSHEWRPASLPQFDLALRAALAAHADPAAGAVGSAGRGEGTARGVPFCTNSSPSWWRISIVKANYSRDRSVGEAELYPATRVHTQNPARTPKQTRDYRIES